MGWCLIVLVLTEGVYTPSELLTIEEGTHDITYRQPTEVGTAINNFLLTKT